MSSNTEEADQKKKSQAIDKVIEEDSKRLRKECKILLLGELSCARARRIFGESTNGGADALTCRVWRERQVHHCQTNENHTPQRLLRR